MGVLPSDNDVLDRSSVQKFFKNVIVKYDYLFFFLFAFCITWGLAILIARTYAPVEGGEVSLLDFTLKAAIPVHGPHMAAVLLTYLRAGKPGLKALYRRATKLNVGIQWYLIAFFLPFIIILIAEILAALGGETLPSSSVSGSLILVYFILFLIVPGIGEEMGWRGYAQPALQRKFNPTISSLIIGIFWALWHFPSFLDPTSIYRDANFGLFLIMVVALAVIYGWLYNNTGSIFFPIIYHTMHDLAISVLYNPNINIVVHVIIALILVVRDRGKNSPYMKCGSHS